MEQALEDQETVIVKTRAQIADLKDKIAASELDPEKRTVSAPRKTRTLRHYPSGCEE